jgi:hypothetical protein
MNAIFFIAKIILLLYQQANFILLAQYLQLVLGGQRLYELSGGGVW